MTREELIAKVEKHKKDDFEYLKPLTCKVIDNLLSTLDEESYCPEKTGLKIYLKEITNILEIMRPDLLDHDMLSIIKHLIEKRLETIRKETLS